MEDFFHLLFIRNAKSREGTNGRIQKLVSIN
jgi:hypothetical protein